MSETRKLPQVLVAQLGARMHYAVPVLLHRAGLLAHFYTDIFVSPRVINLFGRCSFVGGYPLAVRRWISRFTPELPPSKITAFTSMGFILAWKHKWAGADLSKQHQVNLWAGETFAQKVIKRGFDKANIIYAILGEGFGIVTHPKAQELFKITDVMISPNWYSLVGEEHSRWPGWAKKFKKNQFEELANFDLGRFAKQWSHSDLLLCPSEFVRESVIGHGGPINKCVVIPYGFTPKFRPGNSSQRNWAHGNLTAIFVGGVVLGKGVQYLYEAMRLLDTKAIKIQIVGSWGLSDKALEVIKEFLDLRGQVPRSEICRFYEQADVFVFPSICDSFGIVQVEALAAGLPVITTPNAGSVVRDGIDGFIVPIRDPEAIVEKLDLLARDRELLAWMSENARQRAREFTWEKYGERLINCILERVPRT